MLENEDAKSIKGTEQGHGLTVEIYGDKMLFSKSLQSATFVDSIGLSKENDL